jgi:hypothetical protein
MSVKTLKKILRGIRIPDETPVFVISDYNLCSRWDIKINEEEDENGKYQEVIINVLNHAD